MANMALPTTTAQQSYQYDVIDESGGDSSYYDAAVASSSSVSSSENLFSSLNQSASPLIGGDDVDESGNEFASIMENRSNDSDEFRVMIVCLGLVVISVGILANLVFSLLVLCRRQRQRHQRRHDLSSSSTTSSSSSSSSSLSFFTSSSSLLIMTSMSLVYFIFLVAYSFKISVYFSGDNIIKFHIYDTIENWSYGNLMCKLTASLPVMCKLISRLSLLALALKRLVSHVFACGVSENDADFYDYEHDSEVKTHDDSDVNIIKKKKASNNRRRRQVLRAKAEVTTTESTNAVFRLGRKLARQMRRLFEWPLVLMIVVVIWSSGAIASAPLFASFELRDANVCDSLYRFPEDIRAVQALWFNYLIYGLVLPMGVVFVILVTLFLLQTSRFCASFLHAGNGGAAVTNGSSLSSSTFSSASPQSTPNRKNEIVVSGNGGAAQQQPFKSSSTASFDDNSSKDDHLCSSSSSSTYSSTFWYSSPSSCTSRARENNLLLWLMWLLMMITSLPQEIYRYNQLRIDFNNDQVLSSYLESILMQPVVRARPYYAAQLIYTAEFALMPLLFILFYSCSTMVTQRRHQRAAAGNSANNKRIPSQQHRGGAADDSGILAALFYDSDLAGRYYRSAHSKNQQRRSTPNDVERETAKGLLFSGTPDDINHYPLVANKTSNGSEPKLIYSKKLSKPTPFELAAAAASVVESSQQPNFQSTNTTQTATAVSNGSGGNVLHIIQHPSWRINIKQQPQQQQQQQTTQHFFTSNNTSSHHPDEMVAPSASPFSYTKNSLFKN